MPLAPGPVYQTPDFWAVFGHSYMQYAFGTYTQNGRADALFFAAMDTEPANKRNWAVNGSRACIEVTPPEDSPGSSRDRRKPQRGGPYTSDGGAALFCWGINDLGLAGFTTPVQDGVPARHAGQ